MTFNELVDQKNYTVYRLSKDTGLAKTTIYDIYSGKSNLLDCSGRILLQLSKCLGIKIEELLKLSQTTGNSFYDKNIPEFLKTSITNYKNSVKKESSLVDCYWDELNSSINVAETEHLITKEQANYLRNKYL